MSGLPPGIKNWHWRTKGVEPWAKAWFETELTGIEANGVSISSVKDVEGDCEVGMRKSKLVTIYDQKITMTWTATDSEGNTVHGTLVALEVAHDMDEDEYVFTSTLESGSGKEADAFHSTAKKALANKLRPKFQVFPKVLLETHGKDLLSEDAGSGASTPASGATTPAPAAAAAAPAPAAKAKDAVPSVAGLSLKQSGAVVKAEGEFQCDAESLFDFLTNSEKVPLWSRNPATIKPEVGADVSLFGGNIAGKVEAVSRPNSITMSWRAPTWPENYFGTLETTLVQGSSSTTLNLRLTGVPVGKEDETERNLSIFYLNGLRQIGSVLSTLPFRPAPSSSPSSSSTRTAKRAPPKKQYERPSIWLYAANAGITLFSFGIVGALGAAFYYGPSGPGGKA